MSSSSYHTFRMFVWVNSQQPTVMLSLHFGYKQCVVIGSVGYG